MSTHFLFSQSFICNFFYTGTLLDYPTHTIIHNLYVMCINLHHHTTRPIHLSSFITIFVLLCFIFSFFYLVILADSGKKFSAILKNTRTPRPVCLFVFSSSFSSVFLFCFCFRQTYYTGIHFGHHIMYHTSSMG